MTLDCSISLNKPVPGGGCNGSGSDSNEDKEPHVRRRG